MPPPRITVREIPVPPFDALNQKAGGLRAAGFDVISLGQAVPGFGPPAAAIDAARRALDVAGTHRYSADAGTPGLRDALCEKLAEHQGVADVTPDDVIITAGGNQAFMLAALTLLDPGAEVVLASPYFVNHEMAVRAVGAIAVEAPLDPRRGFTAQWADIEPHLTARTAAVVLCTPSNPTGAVIGGEALARIVRELSSRRVALICDETYLQFVYGERSIRSAAAMPGWRDTVTVVGTFSKSFGMTGWRAGYMLADGGFCEEALKIQDAMIICAPVISQVAVEAAIRSDWNYAGGFHEELLQRRDALERGIRSIPQLDWSPAPGGFFAFVRVESCRDSMALAAEILQRTHVVTIPGAAFGKTGEGYLRLSYGAVDVDRLTEACARLKTFFLRSGV